MSAEPTESNASDVRGASDPRLLWLVEAIGDAIIVATRDGQVVESNPAAQRLFGYSADELRRLHRDDLVVHDARLAAAQESRDRTGTFRGELTYIRNGGSRFTGDVAIAQLATPEGEPRVWLVIRDRTEQLRAASALDDLHRSEATFRALSEATFEAILIHHDGVILLANRAAELMYRVEPGGMVGTRLFDFVAEESLPLIRAKVQARDERPYEAFGRRSDGTVFPAEVQARTVTTIVDGVSARVVVIRDITERKQLELSLALADRMASLGTLAAGVAHEINNPLAVVMMALDLSLRKLERSAETDVVAVTRGLRDAQICAKRIQQIVRDLSALSRNDEVAAGPVDLAKVVAYAANVVRHQLKHHSELIVDLQDLPAVWGIESRLGQVVLNLLVNASQALAADRPGRIAVRARPLDAGHVVLEVIDNGSGIPHEQQARIFEPFFTTKSVHGGSGLGLAICHNIVHGFGGEIAVESDPGKGATFRVTLRTATSQAAVGAAAGIPSAPAAGTELVMAVAPTRAHRLLLVDDEPLIQRAWTHALSPHEVVGVENAEQAVRLLEAGESFDLVLCDLMMPGLGGAGLLQQLERRWPALLPHFVFATGGAVTHPAEEALSRVPHPPILKPISLAALQERVRALLAR